MCLISKSRFPRISFRRIPIYKLVRETEEGLITPFMYCYLRTKANGTLYPQKGYKGYEIGPGMIHAYVSLECAERQKTRSLKIIKGYIPRFTRYYIGRDSFIGDICAKRMIYEDIS